VKSLLAWPLVLAMGYGLLCLWLYFAQDSMIFFPASADPARTARLAGALPGFREISLTAGDGTHLSGYLRQPQNVPDDCPLVLYFGGNAEEASHIFEDAALFSGWAVASVNYRGYGASVGKPGEAALRADALAVFDALASGRRVVVVMGRSLGSVLAAHVAAKRPVAAALLVTPCDSVASVAKDHYRFFPVGLLLRHPFDALADARAATATALFLAAGQDDVVPASHARTLYDAWAGPKRFTLVEGVGHNDISFSPDYGRAVKEYLGEVSSSY
jgi:uncharacterized protein